MGSKKLKSGNKWTRKEEMERKENQRIRGKHNIEENEIKAWEERKEERKRRSEEMWIGMKIELSKGNGRERGNEEK